MCGLKVDIITMPSLIVMMGVCFSKESVKKWWKISMTN